MQGQIFDSAYVESWEVSTIIPKSFLFIPELQIAVIAVDGAIFISRNFVPHESARLIVEVEVLETVIELIKTLAISYEGVRTALQDPIFLNRFS